MYICKDVIVVQSLLQPITYSKVKSSIKFHFTTTYSLDSFGRPLV